MPSLGPVRARYWRGALSRKGSALFVTVMYTLLGRTVAVEARPALLTNIRTGCPFRPPEGPRA